MSVESKLNALLVATGQIAAAQATNQAATLQAIATITPGGSQAITDAIAQIEGQVSAIQTTLGAETDGIPGTPSQPPALAPAPAPVGSPSPAPAPAPASSGPGASS